MMREDTYEGEIVDTPKEKSPKGIRCDACPVLCLVKPNDFGACDRYTNVDGNLTRVDPLVISQRPDAKLVPFLAREWDGRLLPDTPTFVTGVGATTTYPCLLYTSPSPRD